MTREELLLHLRNAERDKVDMKKLLEGAVEELATKTSENKSLRARLYSTNHEREQENRALRTSLGESKKREAQVIRQLHGGLKGLNLTDSSLADILALSEKAKLLLETYDLVEDPIFFAEPCGRIIYANPATHQFFGSMQDVDLYTLCINDLEDPYRASSEESVVQEFPKPKQRGPSLITQLDPSNPSSAVIRRHVKVETLERGKVDVLLTLRMMHGAENQPLIMVKVVDLEGVHRDSLTGLWLRDTSDKALDRNIASRNRDVMRNREAASLSVMIVDIDHFKKVNDTYGHLTGDEVIKSVSRRLHRHFKRSTDLVARWGGEELLVISEMTEEELFKAAETFRTSLAVTPVKVVLESQEALAVPVTVSIGVASWRPSMDKKMLTGIADESLYHAKNGGRNRTVSQQFSCHSVISDVG